MLFRNFHNLNRLFREFESFDDLFFENPTLKGKEKIQTGTDELGEWEKRSFVSDSGLFSYSFITRKSDKSQKTNEIESLKLELEQCVEKQDFEKAVELRDKIKFLEENKEELSKLNEELEGAIQKQDFERAIELRDQIKKLK
jgi:excinuclease UvrABC helicase subunit UvrB